MGRILGLRRRSRRRCTLWQKGRDLMMIMKCLKGTGLPDSFRREDREGFGGVVGCGLCFFSIACSIYPSIPDSMTYFDDDSALGGGFVGREAGDGGEELFIVVIMNVLLQCGV